MGLMLREIWSDPTFLERISAAQGTATPSDQANGPPLQMATKSAGPQAGSSAIASSPNTPVPQSLTISPANPTLVGGWPRQFKAYGVFPDGSKDVTTLVKWSSSGMVTIDDDKKKGLATAQPGSGSAVITASYPSNRVIAASTTATVTADPTPTLSPEEEEKAELYADMETMDMRSLLNALTKLNQAGTLDEFADLPDLPDRVGAAILTVRGDFGESWRQVLNKLSKADRQAILERTPADVRSKVEKPEKDDDDDDDGPIEVGVDGPPLKGSAGMQAQLKFHSSLAGDLGETTVAVHIGPGGKLKQVEIDVTALKKNITAIKDTIEKMGVLGPMLELEATLSLNATADNKAVNLDADAGKVVFGAVQVQVKGEIQAQFKGIKILKKVAFKLSISGGSGGFSASATIEFPIPSL
jgi:hypothetical protein